jgi:hypothetical protein
MSTYDYDKVMADYANGRMTVEMAMGHSLQHIGKLYEALGAANASRPPGQQARLDALERRVHALQAAVDRLTAFIEQGRAKRKQASPSQPKPDQP